MHPRSILWLEDIRDECRFLRETIPSREEFAGNPVLRRAAERSLEIIGEAIRRLERDDQDLVERIPDHHRIIGLRNRIAHEYDDLDDAAIWFAVTTAVARLEDEIVALIDDAETD